MNNNGSGIKSPTPQEAERGLLRGKTPFRFFFPRVDSLNVLIGGKNPSAVLIGQRTSRVRDMGGGGAFVEFGAKKDKRGVGGRSQKKQQRQTKSKVKLI